MLTNGWRRILTPERSPTRCSIPRQEPLQVLPNLAPMPWALRTACWYGVPAFATEELGHIGAGRHAHGISVFGERSERTRRRRGRLVSLPGKFRSEPRDRACGYPPRIPVRAARRDGQHHQSGQSDSRKQRDQRPNFCNFWATKAGISWCESGSLAAHKKNRFALKRTDGLCSGI